MIAELGHFCLVLTLGLALVQGSLPVIGAARNRKDWMELADSSATAMFILVSLSFAALTYSFVTSDFSVVNVYENSHSQKPMLYKISGVWGNHEGSLLLWILILALFSYLVRIFGGNLPPSLKARVLGVQAWIITGFCLFILFTSNPFERIPLDSLPIDGRGLNPLLQDPGLAFHPPMLYAGYVGLSMAFSFAVAALLEGRVDAAWARWVRPWTLLAWVFLTLGIALGSWWAYYELGWGGYWYWDPVENASFMPWLIGTALLHSAIVAEKRDALKAWTILLAIIAFSMSLLGTFLVRSGVITSVHAFATDPTRGVFILILLCVAIGGSLTLYAIRAPALKGGGLFAPVSREGSLLINNVLMTTAAATVLLGTLYPLIADALNLGKVTVGPPFFNAVFVPIMIPTVALMAIGPFLAWKRGDLKGAMMRMWTAAAAAVATLAAVFLISGGGLNSLGAAFGVALGVWLLAGTLAELGERIKLFRIPLGQSLSRARNLPRSALGMTLAHAGMAFVVLGVVVNSAHKAETVQAMKLNEAVTLSGWTYTLEDVVRVDGPNYAALRGIIALSKDGERVATLTPEKRQYSNPPQSTTEAGIHTTGVTDLYAVIGDPTPAEDGSTAFVTRFYHEPAVPLLWYGSILMGLGGLVSLSDRRHRVGAPARHKRDKASSGPAPQPAE
ncbi:MAG: heme lyase CcmF/NrfE family subunit [Rhodospirillaceae bacterium]